MTASLFTITPTPPTSITVMPGGEGKFSFTITSLAAPDKTYELILQALLVGADGKTSEVDWLAPGPSSTLTMAGGETKTVTITAKPTVKIPPGKNTVKLALGDKGRPNDEFTYSAPVVCEIAGPSVTPPPQKKFPWWIIAVAGGVVVLAGAGILIWKLTSHGGSPPVVDAPPIDAAPPADAPPVDAAPPIDARPPIDAAVNLHTVLVTTTGDDSRDGLTAPVKTLKRAIAIANGNGAITAITLSAGKYGAANGETFPYTVPANVTISGAASGGTILAGTAAVAGLTLDTGKLADLQLESFGTAIKATGTATLSNVKARGNTIAVSVETAARLTADKLDITGVAGACNTGMVVRGSGRLTVTGLTASAVAMVLSQSDQSSASIATGTVAADSTCARSVISSNAPSLVLNDVTISGGQTGIAFTGDNTTTAATLTNITISDAKGNAISGRVRTARITGGELRNNGRGAIETFAGSWILTNVGIKGNPTFGIYLQGGGASAPGTLVMRSSTVSGNGNGIYLFDFAIADLGTASSPGNNTIQGNIHVGLDIDGNGGPRRIEAVGNTWRPNVQNANAQGKYSSKLVSGPVANVNTNNFAINPSWSLQL